MATLHLDAHQALVSAVTDRAPIVVRGGLGLGKTMLAREAVERIATELALTVMAVSVSSSADDALARLAPAAAGSVADIARGIAFMVRGGVLLIDDAHRLSADDNAVLEQLVRYHSQDVRLVLTSREVGSSTLRRLKHDAVLREVTLHPIESGQGRVIVEEAAAPARLDAEATENLLAAAAGTPVLLATVARALAEQSPGQKSIAWDGNTLPRPLRTELDEILLEDLTSIGKTAAYVAALIHPVSVADLARFAGEGAVEDLLDSGLVREKHDRLTFTAPLMSSVLALTAPRELAQAVWTQLALPALPAWNGLPSGQRDSIVALSVRAGEHLPVKILSHERGPADHPASFAHAITWSTAMINHPASTPTDKLLALAVRMDGYRWAGNSAAAHADIAASAQYVDDATVRARIANATARTRVLQYMDGDHQGALALLRDESRALTQAGLNDPATTTQLRVSQAVVLAYGGAAAEASRAFAAIFANNGFTVDTLDAVAPAAMLATLRGDLSRARSLVNRAFPLALLKSKQKPIAPGEIVIASYFADLVSGRVGAAARTQKRISASLAKDRGNLPAHDIALSRVGVGMIHSAHGAWSDAIVELEAALERYGERDPFGQRSYVLAQYALALAASGDRDGAVAATLEANEGITGTARIAVRFVDVQILTARMWCDEDVTSAALRVAEQSREDQLYLMELRALHLLALSSAQAITPALLERALEIAAGSSAPIAAPLAGHIHDLANGVSRLASTHARVLARHGVFVPLRGVVGELTTREREVAIAASLGYPSKTIAQLFGNSKRTIDAHLNRIYVKLGVDGRDDLASVLDDAPVS